MKTHIQWRSVHFNLVFTVLCVSLFLLFLGGCVSDTRQVNSKPGLPEQSTAVKDTDPDTSSSPDQQQHQAPLQELQSENQVFTQPGTGTESAGPGPEIKIPAPVTQKSEKKTTPSDTETRDKTNQELLDSAMEFCNVSNDFWVQGDLENAMDALDQAYSLILQVDTDPSPDILQQRDDLRITIAKKVMRVYSSRFSVVNGNHHAIPLTMNKDVEHAIKLFQGKERDFFLKAYRRSGKYRPAIVRELKKAGIPESLSWLPLIESGYKVRALSRARALGMWQFIASTGYKYGLERDRWVDERMDPEKSTQAAIAYLKELHQIFGDWLTVLAAYNCGEGRVLRCIKDQRIDYLDHFWDLYSRLPRETAFYVPKFLAVLHIINDPKAYGFTLPSVDKPLRTDVVTINKPLHLKTMAKHLGIPYDTLKDLNPALRYYSTPDRPYAFNMPKGMGKELLAKLDTIPRDRPGLPSYATYRVRKGDTLSTIASRYRTSVRSIMAANHLNSKRYIKAGSQLKIPTAKRYAASSTQRDKKAASTTSPPARYRVKKGDSLWKIARRYNATTKEIQSLNRLHTSRLSIGQMLKIPGGSTSSRTRTAKVRNRPSSYQVQKGDSLWKIARRYNTTTSAIQSLNGLNNTGLSIGQVLKIPQVSASTQTMQTRSYTVSKGDSPYLIARKHQMELSELLSLNRLTPRSTIFPGQILLVKAN